MKIIVQQLGGLAVEPLTLDVDSQATLSDLKTLIRESKGIDTNIILQLVPNGSARRDCCRASNVAMRGFL